MKSIIQILVLIQALLLPLVSSAATASGKANQIITLSIKDASSTGNNIYNDLLRGEMYAVSYSWKSSNESVTQWVDKVNTFAYVKFTKAGNYTVSYDLKYSFSGASRTYSFSCTWEVNVAEDGPTSVSVTADKYTIEVGESTTARASLYGGSGSITWSKGSASCISITPSGTTCQIKGLSKGSATVTATTNNGRTDHVTITVKEPDPIPNTIKLSKSNIELSVGEVSSITATITGDNSHICNWTCSDSGILSLSPNGKTLNITALKDGKATIYATAYDGTKASCNVTINKDLSPKGISIDPQVLELKLGQEASLTATLTPIDAQTEITWTSSNKNVVNVENGKVKAVGIGKADVTAKTSNGLSASCKITVVENEITSKTDWAGHYNVSASHVVNEPTRDYPDNFEMDIEKVGNDWYVTSMFGVDLKTYNDGGFKLQDNGDGTASVDILNNGILQYTNSDNPLYVIYVFDEEADNWGNTWEFKMNDDGAISIEDFYVVAFTWSEADEIWKNGKLEAFYYDVIAKKGNSEGNPSDEHLDIYLCGSNSGWLCSKEWEFIPYNDEPTVYYFRCTSSQSITPTDMFFIITEDWSTVMYGLEASGSHIGLGEMTKLTEGENSWNCMLDSEWNGICWLDIKSGTIVFSNDPNYVAPFANSAVGSIFEESNEVEEYYDLKGQKVDKTSLGSGIYIVRKGSNSKKIMIK